MPDYPNLFPGLTEEDRARIAAIAGNLETLPELLDRLNGFANDLSKVRAVLPALVVSFPIPKWQNQPLQVGTPAALMVDDSGRLMTCLPRRRLDNDVAISIPGGGTVSEWVNVTDNALDHLSTTTLWDDKARLAAEVITLQGSWKNDHPDATAASPDAYTITASVLGATIGVTAALSAIVGTARWIRLSSAVAVGASGRSFRITGISQ